MFSFEETVVTRLIQKSGFPVNVGQATGNPLTGRLWVKDLTIGNPEGYPLKDFLFLKEMKVHFSPGSLLRRRIRVKDLEIHLGHLTGVRAETGAINIEEFREALERREEGEESHGRHREFDIGRLSVTVDYLATVTVKGTGMDRRDYPLAYSREFRDVTDWLAVACPVLDDFERAGLGRKDEVFATILPEFLWQQVRAASR